MRRLTDMYSVTNYKTDGKVANAQVRSISNDAIMCVSANLNNRKSLIASHIYKTNKADGCRISAGSYSSSMNNPFQETYLSKPTKWQTAIIYNGNTVIFEECPSGFASAENLFNGKQQDAYRCIPPGRNPCGGASWKQN